MNKKQPYILIAEDMEANTYLYEEELKRLGCLTDIAENGAIATEMAGNNKYDLIFMDINMPVMDGPEALAKIRASGGPNTDTPVIALTGGNLNMPEQASETFSEFLTKPVSSEQFSLILDQWLNRKAEAPALKPETSKDDGAFEVIDAEFLYSAIGTTKDKIATFVTLAVNDGKKFVRQCRQNLDSKDSENLARTAHALKSVASQSGAKPLERLAKQLENAGKNADFSDQTRQAMQDCETEFERYRLALYDILRRKVK